MLTRVRFSTDGQLFMEDSGWGSTYGTPFKQGDTIGCGRAQDGKYLFTVNGK